MSVVRQMLATWVMPDIRFAEMITGCLAAMDHSMARRFQVQRLSGEDRDGAHTVKQVEEPEASNPAGD